MVSYATYKTCLNVDDVLEGGVQEKRIPFRIVGEGVISFHKKMIKV